MKINSPETVQECIELLRQGVSVEECLERYPDEAVALEPALRAAVSLSSGLAAELPLTTRARVRSRVLGEWDRQSQPRRWNLSLPVFVPKWAFATAILVLALALGGLGTNTAAANSVPGGVLYPVKEFREGVQLWLARSPEAKVEMYTSLVKERVAEVKKIAAQKQTDQADIEAISDALARMEVHLTALNIVVANKLSDGAVEDANLGFVESLQESITEQDTAGSVLEKVLAEVPTEVRSDLRDALKALQTAQGRVDAALEAVK
ncbi:MAG: hypothetical protein HQ475_13255 [SAR202 cluster bacterium]|nr:hypothetical protein [SAR202 cluster bacterium]